MLSKYEQILTTIVKIFISQSGFSHSRKWLQIILGSPALKQQLYHFTSPCSILPPIATYCFIKSWDLTCLNSCFGLMNNQCAQLKSLITHRTLDVNIKYTVGLASYYLLFSIVLRLLNLSRFFAGDNNSDN